MTHQDLDHPAIRALINEKARNHGWHDAAEYAMKLLADRGTPFTANDLRTLMGTNTPETPNAIGGLFLSWRQQKLIHRTGYTASNNRKSNGSMIFQWQGTKNTH